MRRLRVLYGHPALGRPGDVIDGFEGAQAYVDIDVAEWVGERRTDAAEVVDRGDAVETADRVAPETTARRNTRRRR